jgi:predicted transcriptional regulator
MKDQVIYVRADKEDVKNLDYLCAETRRRRSDMVRWLIDQEIERRKAQPGSKPAEPVTRPQ